jgi:hypothetical protein
MKMKNSIFGNFNLETQVQALDSEIVDLKRTMDMRNEKIMDILEKIRDWEKANQPYLDRIKEEQDAERKAINKAIGKPENDENTD